MPRSNAVRPARPAGAASCRRCRSPATSPRNGACAANALKTAGRDAQPARRRRDPPRDRPSLTSMRRRHRLSLGMSIDSKVSAAGSNTGAQPELAERQVARRPTPGHRPGPAPASAAAWRGRARHRRHRGRRPPSSSCSAEPSGLRLLVGMGRRLDAVEQDEDERPAARHQRFHLGNPLRRIARQAVPSIARALARRRRRCASGRARSSGWARRSASRSRRLAIPGSPCAGIAWAAPGRYTSNCE